MNEKKKGGVRPNSGRKPTDDPKIPITVYVETSIVEKNGGKVELAQRIVDTVKSDFVANPILERVIENNKPEVCIAEDDIVFTHPEPTTNYTIDTTKEEQIRELEEKIKLVPSGQYYNQVVRGLRNQINKLKYNQ